MSSIEIHGDVVDDKEFITNLVDKVNDAIVKCKDCIMNQPNDLAAEKDPEEWVFPADYECARGDEYFPEHGHLCMHFGHIDNYRKAEDD